MFCTKCGYNAGTAKFCPKCGTSLISAASNNTSSAATTNETQAYTQPQYTASQAQAYSNAAQPQYGTSQAQAYGNAAQPQYGASQAYGNAAQPQYGTSQAQAYGNAAQPQYGASQTQAYGNAAQPQYGTSQTQAYGNAAQPQYGTGQAYGGDMIPRYQAPSQSAQSVQPSKKKKKWPFILGIVALVAAIVAVVCVVVIPRLSKNFSSEKQAVTAVKNVAASLEESVNTALESDALSSVSDKVEISGKIAVSSASFDGENFSDYFKADTVSYDIQFDASTGKSAGDIKLLDGSSTLVTASFYCDGTTVYFKVPELFSESFKISVSDIEDSFDYSSSASYSVEDILSYSTMLDDFDIDLYREPIKAAVAAVFKGVDTFADKCEYTKNGNITYNSDNGSIEVIDYTMTVTEAAVVEFFNTTVDALYEDSQLSYYMSMLSSLGLTQESLKTKLADSVEGMDPFEISMYLNEDGEIVRVSIDASEIDEGESGSISLAFIGSDKLTDYFVFEMEADDLGMKYTVKNEGNSSTFAIEVLNDDESITGSIKCTSQGNGSITIDDISMNMDTDDVEGSVEISGDYTQKEYSTMMYSASNFTNAIDVDNLTTAQEDVLANELIKNIDVFSKIFSNATYKELFNELSTSTTSTTTSGSTTGTDVTGTTKVY